MSERAAERPQFITPPNTLRAKVEGSGPPSSEMIRKAQEAVERLGRLYPNWALDDVEALAAALGRLTPGVSSEDGAVREVYRLAHDMKGQGASFNYPLVTEIGRSFCRYLERIDYVGTADLSLLTAHVSALRAVIGQQISGDGGDIGEQIVSALYEAAEKRLTAPS